MKYMNNSQDQVLKSVTRTSIGRVRRRMTKSSESRSQGAPKQVRPHRFDQPCSCICIRSLTAAPRREVVPYTSLGYVESNQVAQVEIKEQSLIRFTMKNGITAQSRIPYFDEDLLHLEKAGS